MSHRKAGPRAYADDGWIRHVIADISYRAEAIECACGAIVTAAPDPVDHEAHSPLVDAWAAHRAENARYRKPRLPPSEAHVWYRG